MTEKRFMLDDAGEVIDLQTHQFIDYGKEIVELLNNLHEEKEYWKSNCCSQDSFNSILLHELDIAQQQGYEVSDPFKKLMEEKRDLE